MNNPNFEYTKVLTKTLQDLFTNIAASPGDFLGDLRGSQKVDFKIVVDIPTK